MRVVKNLDLQKKEQLETSFDRFLLFVDICFCLDVVGNFFAPFFEEVELESILVDDPRGDFVYVFDRMVSRRFFGIVSV